MIQKQTAARVESILRDTLYTHHDRDLSTRSNHKLSLWLKENHIFTISASVRCLWKRDQSSRRVLLHGGRTEQTATVRIQRYRSSGVIRTANERSVLVAPYCVIKTRRKKSKPWIGQSSFLGGISPRARVYIFICTFYFIFLFFILTVYACIASHSITVGGGIRTKSWFANRHNTSKKINNN